MPEPTAAFIDDVFAPLEMIYAEAAGEAAGGAISFEHLDQMAAKYGEERGAELVGMKKIDGKWVENPNAEWVIDKTTRDETNRLLQEAMKEGLSPQEFAQRLKDSGLYGEARAEVIARTEVAIAQNYGQSETYGEMGFSRVYVQDGDCDICREVDGKVASLAWIQNNPVAHPACVRSVSPAPDDEEIELE